MPPIIGNVSRNHSPGPKLSLILSKRKLPPRLGGEINKDSPGVCFYDPKTDSVLKKSPRAPQGHEDRFKWLGSPKDSVEIPLVYEKEIGTKPKRNGVTTCRSRLVGQVPQEQSVHRGQAQSWSRRLRAGTDPERGGHTAHSEAQVKEETRLDGGCQSAKSGSWSGRLRHLQVHVRQKRSELL